MQRTIDEVTGPLASRQARVLSMASLESGIDSVRRGVFGTLGPDGPLSGGISSRHGG
jgi:hypothetical protein